MNIIKKTNASIFLFFNAILWGSSYVWSKMLLGYLPRFYILFLCSLGGLVSTIIIFHFSIREMNIYAVVSSCVVSSFSIVSNTFFMLALQHTGSSNTAFIVQTSVIITPLLMAVLEKKAPHKKIVVSALIALSGLFLLTCDVNNLQFKAGDIFALGNAFFFSLFLVGMNIISKKVDSGQFSFVHHTTNTIGFFIMAVVMEQKSIEVGRLWSLLFVILISASVFISVITVLIQSAALQYVRPEKAALIYSFEPVATLIIAYVLIGEKLKGMEAVVGCILILLAVCYSNYRSRIYKERFDTERTPQTVLE